MAAACRGLQPVESLQGRSSWPEPGAVTSAWPSLVGGSQGRGHTSQEGLQTLPPREPGVKTSPRTGAGDSPGKGEVKWLPSDSSRHRGPAPAVLPGEEAAGLASDQGPSVWRAPHRCWVRLRFYWGGPGCTRPFCRGPRLSPRHC